MITRRWALGPVLAAVGVGTALLTAPAEAADGGRPFDVVLSGADEVSPFGGLGTTHGDADRGSIKLTLNPGQEEVCWSVGELTLTPGDGLPFAGHIHEAPAGVSGPVVIPLFGGAAGPAPTSYPTGTTCVPVARALVKEILQDPSAYYANLHNVPHGGGVMRGQLAK